MVDHFDLHDLQVAPELRVRCYAARAQPHPDTRVIEADKGCAARAAHDIPLRLHRQKRLHGVKIAAPDPVIVPVGALCQR